MENVEETKLIMNELRQGLGLARQLGRHLRSSSSIKTRESLLKKIMFSYDRALQMLKSNKNYINGESNNGEESPESSLDRDSSSPEIESGAQFHKRRKAEPQWIKQVRICSEGGDEGRFEDGFSWRKYGQKEILGSTFPRGYYRCSYRHVQDCYATKQVQKSDNDPSIFEITYRGIHTCNVLLGKRTPLTSPAKENAKQSIEESEEVGLNLKVKTEEIETRDEIFPSFSFTDMGVGNSMMGDILAENSGDSADMVSEANFVADCAIGELNFGLDSVELDIDFSFEELECFS